MRTKIWSVVGMAVVAAGLLGCPSSGNLSKTEAGGVYLSVTDFDGLPICIGVNAAAAPGAAVQVDTIVVTSIAVNAGAPTSALMNTEMETYEVGFTRADQGTRRPNPTERRIFGTVPVNSALTYNGLPIMTAEEFTNPPLSDLLFQNGGVDKETGSEAILLNLELKFFGQTLNGTKVKTRVPARFTLQFVPSCGGVSS